MGFFLKLLGLVDIAAAVILFLASADLFPARWVLVIAACLFIKGILFFGDPVSFLDIIIGVAVAMTLFTALPPLLTILFGLYLSIKGVYSFI